ncbi:hypothetical protein [Thermoanaerobacterium thermosaccharolyticum]|nr:hypothetical protein [Thermoanaerobacterium thermosaccharolyticum]MCP2241033.1 hypothetical protein [Thermoanaerobacterium thermosaccharolyticum]
MGNMQIYDEILYSYKRCVEAELTSLITHLAIILKWRVLLQYVGI